MFFRRTAHLVYPYSFLAYVIGLLMIRRWAERLLAIVLTMALVQGFVPVGQVSASAQAGLSVSVLTATASHSSVSVESTDPVSHPMVETAIVKLCSGPPKRDGDGSDGDTAERALILLAAFATLLDWMGPPTVGRPTFAYETTGHGPGRPCEAGRCPTGPPAIA